MIPGDTGDTCDTGDTGDTGYIDDTGGSIDLVMLSLHYLQRLIPC